MNAEDLGKALFERRRPVLSARAVRVRETHVNYHEWRTLVEDGLVEAATNDHLTRAERDSALELVDAGYFGASGPGLRDLIENAQLTAA